MRLNQTNFYKILQTELNGVNSRLNTLLEELKNNSTDLLVLNPACQQPATNSSPNRTNKSSSGGAVKILWDSSFNMTTKMYTQKDTSNKDELPERVFLRRNSLLTQMFKVIGLYTAKNFFLCEEICFVILYFHIF